MGARRTGALAVVAVLAAAASAGALTASAAGTRAFTDPAGDAGTGFDVTSVSAANDNAGQITFRIGLPAVPALPANLGLLIALNTDLKATGSAGIDYYIVVTGGAATLSRETSGTPAFYVPQSLSSNFQPGLMTVSINRRDLGNTRGFQFGVITLPQLPDGTLDQANADSAPSGPPWPYDLVLPTRLTVASKALARTTGGGFTARVLVRDTTFGPPGTPAAGGAVTCRFTVAGRAVTARGTVATGGAATCRGTAPAGSSGAALKGTVRYSLKGATVTRGFVSTVR